MEKKNDLPPALQELFRSFGPRAPEAEAYWHAVTAGRRAPSPALERRLAEDILALMDEHPAETVRAAWSPMLSTAASRLRAKASGPAGGPHDSLIETLERPQPWRGFFGVEARSLRHRRYNGAMSETLRREVFVSTDAVTVLPYDPVSDQILVVEQFRAGPLVRGGGKIWLVEAVAGRIDPGETPEEAARREAQEEAGLALTELLPVAEYYPSPGALSEFLYSYVGIGPIDTGGLHGMEAEGEDIHAIVWSFDHAMGELAKGHISNAPLILTLLWLERERPKLRARFGAA